MVRKYVKEKGKYMAGEKVGGIMINKGFVFRFMAAVSLTLALCRSVSDPIMRN